MPLVERKIPNERLIAVSNGEHIEWGEYKRLYDFFLAAWDYDTNPNKDTGTRAIAAFDKCAEFYQGDLKAGRGRKKAQEAQA